MAVSSDQRTLFLTNFGSNSLQVLDIDHLPIDPKLPPEIAKNPVIARPGSDTKFFVIGWRLSFRRLPGADTRDRIGWRVHQILPGDEMPFGGLNLA